MKKLKQLLLKIPVTREILFFLFGKKLYRGAVNKKIKKLISGRLKLSDGKIDGCIVSLTSFPERIGEVKYTIFSILSQTVRPEKAVLWLATGQFPLKESELPMELLAFRNFGLEIRWCVDNTRSYKKLVPALQEFPNHCIVTADDDIYYPVRWLEKLWREHQKYPEDVVCHIANKIMFDKTNNVLPYTQWRYNIQSNEASSLYFPIGVGGILWHKDFLAPDVTNKEIFQRLAPHADDVWFYFMAILNNRKTRVVKHPCNHPRYVNPYREYNLISGYKLAAINVDNNQNDIQIQNLIKYYDLDLSLLDMRTNCAAG